MNEEKEFDELLRSKLSEREFPFDELNWDEAERLIVKQERWRKIRRISLVFSAGLAAGVCIMMPFILNNHTASNTPIVSKSAPVQNPVPQNNVSTPPSQSKVTVPNTVASNKVKAPLPVQSAFVKKNTGTGTRGNSSNTSPAVNKTQKQSQPLLAEGNGGIKKSHHPHIANNNSHLVAVANNSHKTSTHKKLTKNETTKIASSQKITNNGNLPETSTVSIATTNNNTNTQHTNTTISNTTINSTASNKNTSSTTNPAGNPGDTTSKFVIAKSTHQITKTSTPLPKIDSSRPNPSMLRTMNVNDANSDFKPSIFILGDAGLNYSFGWTTNGDKEANGATFFGGLGIGYHLSPKLSASVGVDNYEINNLNKTYTSSIIQYDFGQSANITTVTPKSVSYLRFPVNFQYKFSDKIMGSLGLDYLMLLTTSSTVTSYTTNYLGQETNLSSQTQNGYVQGFSNSNFQFTGTFTWIPCCRLGVNLEYYVGVGYVENKSFPGISQYENTSGFRFFLSYQLMK
jgi:hypothetical protein